MPIKFLGSDFQINTFFSGSGLAGNQWLAQITALADGRFAVVYQSDFMGDTHNPDIAEAIFTANGSPTFYGYVNSYSGAQGAPVAAATPNGGFGVAFVNSQHADGTADLDPNSSNITYVPINVNGFDGVSVAVGDFNGGTGHDNLISCAIANLSGGRQVVVFERVYTFLADDDIYLNVVNADGASTLNSPAFPIAVQVNSAFQGEPAVAAIGNSAMVVYVDDTGTTDTSTNISASIFDGNSNSVGLPFTIADHANAVLLPKITALDDHRYVIVYEDPTAFQIFGKIFDTTTNTLSAEFVVSQSGEEPAVTSTSDGGFIVAWAGPVPGDQNILARRYNSDGVAIGQQFLVNQLTDGTQYSPAVAVSGANVMFAWTDDASRPGDTSPTSVRGRIMTLTTPPDFNDNGISDILWRNNNGALALWDMSKGGAISSGGWVTSGGSVVAPGANWSVAAISDFTGDGRADVVWRDSSGQTALWTMNGNAIVGSGSLTAGGTAVNPDPSWSVAGAGDFNGDARADILWRNDNGSLAEWQMKGASIISSFAPTSGGVNIAPDGTWHTQAKPTDFA